MSNNRPDLHIRPVRDADLPAVHAINESAVPHVNSIGLDRFREFTREAAYFRVALRDADESRDGRGRAKQDARADESRDGRGRAKQDARADESRARIVPDNPLHSRHCNMDVQVPRSTGMCKSGHPWRSDARAEVAGYLVAFAPHARYESLNYLWFQERYGDFIYIDRIAVAAGARRHGIASRLYRDIFDFARPRTGLLTCEVNTRPVNAESMAFHERFGFREVGTRETAGGTISVSLMAVELTAPG